MLPPQGAWMSVVGASGEPLDHWDLHVGAELSLAGRKVVLKRVSPEGPASGRLALLCTMPASVLTRSE